MIASRILPVDGLRAFAVLGVVWAHCWMLFGYLPLFVAGANINQLLSFGGMGVDLFFVISGFCMYLMHGKEGGGFSSNRYWKFLKKRWWRIAPAFYLVVFFDSGLHWGEGNAFPTKSLLYHLAFINTFNPQNVLSPPFWSLATEWHFYLILPLILMAEAPQRSLFVRVVLLMTLSTMLRLSLYYFSRGAATAPNDYFVWYRFNEFGFGILAARFYIRQHSLPVWLRGNWGFVLSMLLAFSGRLCMSMGTAEHFGKAAFVIMALGQPILAFGFALMILNLINSESLFRALVSARPLLFMGKISYSMYLWHWLIASWICASLIARWGISALNQEVAFSVCVLCCISVAIISYRLLEAPYFKKRTSVGLPASV